MDLLTRYKQMIDTLSEKPTEENIHFQDLLIERNPITMNTEVYLTGIYKGRYYTSKVEVSTEALLHGVDIQKQVIERLKFSIVRHIQGVSNNG